MVGYLRVLCAGLIWGTTGLFVRSLQSVGLDALSIVILRGMIATILMAAWAAMRDREAFSIGRADLGLLVAIGVSNVLLSQVCFIYTMTHTPIAVAVILNYTAPVFAMFLSRLIYHEPITPAKLLALVFCLGGLVLVVGLDETTGRVVPFYIVTGLGSGFFYALHTVLFKMALKNRSPLCINLWGTGVGTGLAYLLARFGQGGVALPNGITGWGIAALMGLGPGLAAFMLYLGALATVEVSRASVVVMSEPVAAFVLGIAVLGEQFRMSQVAGMVLVLLGIATITTDSYRRAARRQVRQASSGD